MSPRPLTGPRLQRVLALVPWISANPGVTITELAQRFEVDERELERDLELLPLCGLPPYTADRLIDVWVADDGAVSVRLAEYFDRPLRLTPAEGVALLAAGRALLAVPGADPDGPLASALEKLEGALGARGSVVVDVGGADHLLALQRATAAGEQVALDYYSFARDEMTHRVVDPWRVFHAFGAWYLLGHCHQADGERMFRVDRIRALHLTGTPIEHRPAVEEDDLAELVYQPADDDLRVRLLLEPSAAWIVEDSRTESVDERADGRLEVVLPVSTPAFLQRLVLGLGPAVTVLGPPEARRWVVEAVQRVLRRYETSV